LEAREHDEMEDRDLPSDREDREDASHDRRRRPRDADDSPPIESVRGYAAKDPAEETRARLARPMKPR
jgi:hypothetical protein